ncbi:MAG: hypothetical protein U0325_08210 [Polyangiales bacterium]
MVLEVGAAVAQTPAEQRDVTAARAGQGPRAFVDRVGVVAHEEVGRAVTVDVEDHRRVHEAVRGHREGPSRRAVFPRVPADVGDHAELAFAPRDQVEPAVAIEVTRVQRQGGA